GDDELDEIITSFLEAREAGREVDRDAIRLAHPDVASRLDLFFATHDELDRLSRPLRGVLARAGVGPGGGLNGAEEGLPPESGEYTLLGVIGVGGMGIVYRAHQGRLKRDVALKRILAGPLASRVDVERFRNEAETAAGLDHPNIVPIFEVGEHDGRQFLTMK